MNDNLFCGGCFPSEPSAACLDSFRRIGLLKVHWECWTECNLACSFCYRTRGIPLNTKEAKLLLSAVRTGGSKAIVFAGGDPSIRPDITELIECAHSNDLGVEVQTNAHHLSPKFLDALRTVQLVGLSLDGPDSLTHDTFRSKPGNFDRVISLMRRLNEWNIPIIVRSVVAEPNFRRVPEIGRLLEGLTNVRRWSLLEFSPIGDGYLHQDTYTISRETFERVIRKAGDSPHGVAPIDVYGAEKKAGTYALITPSGLVYGTGGVVRDGVHSTVGSILQEHLVDLASKLPFSRQRHESRYLDIMPSGPS
jgi:MoaA/NifB/PqqE/SkfB family radical SAM enzyme